MPDLPSASVSPVSFSMDIFSSAGSSVVYPVDSRSARRGSDAAPSSSSSSSSLHSDWLVSPPNTFSCCCCCCSSCCCSCCCCCLAVSSRIRFTSASYQEGNKKCMQNVTILAFARIWHLIFANSASDVRVRNFTYVRHARKFPTRSLLHAETDAEFHAVPITNSQILTKNGMCQISLNLSNIQFHEIP